MLRVSRKNRNRHLRHLAALAAIGLISLNCASPALGAAGCSPEDGPDNQTICSDDLVKDVKPGSGEGQAGHGLAIEGGRYISGDPADTMATWNPSDGDTISNTTKATGVVFQDGGQGSGNATLVLNGTGDYTIAEGGIKNLNTNSDSVINIKDIDSTLTIGDGDIVGNGQKTLTIKSKNSELIASNSDVTGKVHFEATGDSQSIFTVGSIGGKGSAEVSTGKAPETVGSVKLDVTKVVDNAILNLGGVTDAIINSIGDWSGNTQNTVNIFDTSTLDVTRAEGTLNVVNDNDTDRAAVINQLGNGILNVGGGNVNVDNIVGGATVNIGSVRNPDGSYDRGQVILDVANIGYVDDPTSLNPDYTNIALKNATLKITDSTDGDDSISIGGTDKAGSFTMNSGEGDSRLWADSGKTLVVDNGYAPTVTVGAGGNAIIESDNLEYNAVLTGGTGVGATGAGAVHFDDPGPDETNDSRMIFKSSDVNGMNKFTKGVQIAAGNWEFQGSTTIETTAADNKMTGSGIYFTGRNKVADPINPVTRAATGPDDFVIDGTAGGAIDATGSTLHLNNQLNIVYKDGGGLEKLETIQLGTDSEALVNSITSTVTGGDTTESFLVAKNINTGYHQGSMGAATVENIFVGQTIIDRPAGFTTGLQATETITLNDTIKVTGGLYIDKNGVDPVLKIGRGEGGFLLTDQAAQDSYAEVGAVVELSEIAYEDVQTGKTQTIQLFGKDSSASSKALEALIADMSKNVNVKASQALENSIGSKLEVVTDSNGLVVYKAINENSIFAPSFARPMVDALWADDGLKGLGLHLLTQGNASSDAYNRELVQVMGNTMNSSLMLVQNGATQAFGRLNATAPTLTGYKTVQAVAAPRAATVQAPAPSAAIGVPIRANGAPSIAVQPQPGAAAVPPAPIAPASGSDDGRARGFWITPNFIRMAMDDNYSEGYSGFDVKSMGMMMGYDQWVNENARLGAFLSYNKPKLDSDNQAITADDFQVGVYAQGVMPNGIILNGALAMGRQDYSSTRNVRISDPGLAQQFNEKLEADYSGKSFGAAIEASRPVDLGNNMYIRPSAGYSYQNISLDDIQEETNKAASLAQKISSDTFNIQQARLGTDIGWVNPDNTLTVTGKAYLVANMGDTQPEGTASFITAANSNTFKVQGAELDDNMVNLGLGLKFTPAGTEGLVISLDYDAMFGSNTQSHNLGLMLRYEF